MPDASTSVISADIIHPLLNTRRLYNYVYESVFRTYMKVLLEVVRTAKSIGARYCIELRLRLIANSYTDDFTEL